MDTEIKTSREHATHCSIDCIRRNQNSHRMGPRFKMQSLKQYIGGKKKARLGRLVGAYIASLCASTTLAASLGFFVDEGESLRLDVLKGVAQFIALGATDWKATEPTKGAYNFDFQKSEAAKAVALGITKFSKTVGIYPADSAGVPAAPNWPGWFTALNAADTQAVLLAHVQAAMQVGKGRGDIVIAVNELAETVQINGAWGERLRDCNITRKLGNTWPTRIISAIKQNDPTAIVCWNDNAIEGTSDFEVRRLAWTITNAKAAGAAAVGMQCHRTAAETLAGHLRIRDACNQIRAAGLEPVITELGVKGGTAQDQANAYAKIVSEAVAGGVTRICCWRVFTGWNGETPLFNSQFKPTPALAAVRAVLQPPTPPAPQPINLRSDDNGEHFYRVH